MKGTSDKNHSPDQESDLPVISRPAQRALAEAGYLKLEQFTKVSEADVLKLHGVGPKGIRILREALAEKGLAFANLK
ncbi:helix-hairpin-helix domain-containing protein [Paenibacillus sp. CAU 1782]